MTKKQELPTIDWNTIIAAYEYMQRAKVTNFLGEGFSITVPKTGKDKGKVVIVCSA